MQDVQYYLFLSLISWKKLQLKEHRARDCFLSANRKQWENQSADSRRLIEHRRVPTNSRYSVITPIRNVYVISTT